MKAKNSELMLWDEIFPLEQFDLSSVPGKHDLANWDEVFPLSGLDDASQAGPAAPQEPPADNIKKAA